jgi:hypothetical protein
MILFKRNNNIIVKIYYLLEKVLKVTGVIFRHTVKVEAVMIDCRKFDTETELADTRKTILHNRQQIFESRKFTNGQKA